jgi:hypothetical protein
MIVNLTYEIRAVPLFESGRITRITSRFGRLYPKRKAFSISWLYAADLDAFTLRRCRAF